MVRGHSSLCMHVTPVCSEFTVVDVGDGLVALHNQCTDRWARVTEHGTADSPAQGQFQREWTWERFWAIHALAVRGGWSFEVLKIKSHFNDHPID